MSVRELVVLGTASQVPTRRRNHNGYFLRFDGDGFLFDPGEGTQRQMIHYGVTATSITNILLTHFHGDHCLGFASVVQRISLDNVPHQINSVYPASGQKYYDRLRHASIFRDVAKIEPNPIRDEGRVLTTKNWTLDALHLDHTVECFGYRISEPDQWSVDNEACGRLGLRGPAIGALKRDGVARTESGDTVRLEDVATKRPGQKIAFIMDTRVCDNAYELARDVDLAIIESTYLDSERRDARKNGHLTVKEAATIGREAGARRIVLSHISQRYTDTAPFLEEARAIHDDTIIANDGDMVPVPPRLKGLTP